jgi:hypothetical protein
MSPSPNNSLNSCLTSILLTSLIGIVLPVCAVSVVAVFGGAIEEVIDAQDGVEKQNREREQKAPEEAAPIHDDDKPQAPGAAVRRHHDQDAAAIHDDDKSQAP